MNLKRRIQKLERAAATAREPVVFRIVYEDLKDGSLTYGETFTLEPAGRGRRLPRSSRAAVRE